MWTGRRTATKRFLAASIVALAVPALVVGWLGLALLQKDRELERTRAQERLVNAAALAAAAVEQSLTAVQDRLTPLIGAADADRGTTAAGIAQGSQAVAIVINSAGTWSSSPLLYYPEEADYADTLAPEFVEAERLEFSGRESAALSWYQSVAQASSGEKRAGALARAARAARKLGQPTVALRLYSDLERLGAAAAVGRPSDLVATLERCGLLQETGDTSGLAREAERFDADLLNGRWRFSQAQYRFYKQMTADWLGRREAATPAAVRRREILSAGTTLVREVALGGPAADEADTGRQTFGLAGTRGIAVWRRSGTSIAAAVATREHAQTWFAVVGAIERAHRARISIVDPAGEVWHGSELGSAAVIKAGTETGLPFTIRVVTSDPAGDASMFSEHRRLLAGVVAALGLLIVVGGYVTARGIARELAAARLQSDFVAAVSHEFRTPVASMRQLSELLDEGRVPDEPRRAEYYGLLRRESVRLQRLVENLLDFGRMEAAAAEYRLEPIDLAPFLRALVEDFAEEVRLSGRRLTLAVLAPLPLIAVDQPALARAIWNLLDNAAKYSPSDTPITVEAETVAGVAEIRVRNDGVGIPHHEQSRLFEKFFRGSDARAGGLKGTGLGLAMVKHIVEAHGGTVSVKSIPGSPTTFTLRLPFANRTA